MDSRDDEPFNNPFKQGLGELRARLRRAHGDSRAAAKEIEASAPPKQSGDSSRCRSEAGQDEAFRDAVGNVERLTETRSRRKVRPGLAGASVSARGHRERPYEVSDPFSVSVGEDHVVGHRATVSRDTMARLERGEFTVRSRLDLHGMVLEDAVNAAASFIAACRQKGERCVLIVTGKGRGSTGGRGVIREELPRWLSDGRGSAAVLAFVTARPRDGGSGALYVLLSKPG